MVAEWIGSVSVDGLDGDQPGRERVIVLSDRRTVAVRRKPAARAKKSLSAVIHRFGGHFTLIDRTVLAAWADEASHGYDRVAVETGVLEDGTWTSYALAYAPGQVWSTWGLLRRGEYIEVWQCSSGKTLGRHVRMADALASLPHATEHRRALPIETDSTAGRPAFLLKPPAESSNTRVASD